MTGSRGIRPCPKPIRITLETLPLHATAYRPPTLASVCAVPGHGQDRSSSLRCGRCILTDVPLSGAVHMEAGTGLNGRNGLNITLDSPHPFRDDNYRVA